ncbi:MULTISPECIES: LacI family DNA-binding transcriptional regulator [Streptomyces]|uniref:LacI family DNA-binding transcriptional regulator n=3 Tax=Streptomyces TaxID=1883 RepID=A0ABW9IVQ5_STRGJ|nr:MULTISPECIES: LacI family DNA-binding transcriptional regulator [Streptomyces]
MSFVLNNVPKQTIPEATRQKVLAAAERLGYTPNGPTQALSRGRGSTVLLRLPDFPPSAIVAELVAELDRGLASQGLMLVTHTASPDRQPALSLAAPVAVPGLPPLRRKASRRISGTRRPGGTARTRRPAASP